jgi:hypothetical protein
MHQVRGLIASRDLITIAACLLPLLGACGGSSSSTAGGTPPSDLTYSSNPATYVVGVAITANTPSSHGGAATSYSVSPALPAGLTLDTSTGVIGGRPTAVTPRTDYVVTASNSAGSTTSTLSIGVCGPPAGVLNWWRADGNGVDVIGGNNATSKNGAGFSPGFVGQAFALDGVDDYFAVPHDPGMNVTSAVTVSAWIKRNAVAGYADPVVKKAGEGTGQINGYTLEFSQADASKLMFWVYLEAAGWRASSAASIPLQQWTHVAGVYDGGAVRVYVNGAEAAGPSPATGAIVPSTNELEIGGDPANAGRHYSGLVDEVTIYGRALAASEIQAMHAAGSGGFCP